MKSTRIIGSMLAVALATTGLVAGTAQRSSASVVATVAIVSPEAGSIIYGAYNVQAQAYGLDVDPPKKIQFFVDRHKKPAATVDCLTNLAYASYSCGAQWLWHAAHVGHHSLSAKVVLLDGVVSDRSEKVHVVVGAATNIAVHRVKRAVAGQKIAVSGRVRSMTKGRPGARHVPVSLTIAPAYRQSRTINLRTNKHGVYRKKIRAIANTTITVVSAATARYLASPQTSYVQYVRGRAHCGLSSRHVRIKHAATMRCRMKHLPVTAKYVVQERVHGKWRHGATFYTTHPNHTKIFVGSARHRRMILREVFPASSVYARSVSNVVRLHVG